MYKIRVARRVAEWGTDNSVTMWKEIELPFVPYPELHVSDAKEGESRDLIVFDCITWRTDLGCFDAAACFVYGIADDYYKYGWRKVGEG